ncbi:MAG: DEAD/DEAH box helicase [Phycisphaerales bacterium]|nr:DEAD/DEAH box helicase [Phycisphaerales bacterium]
MRVIHANWSDGWLHLWAESPGALQEQTDGTPPSPVSNGQSSGGKQPGGHRPGRHPFAERSGVLAELLARGAPELPKGTPAEIVLALPALGAIPLPSPTVAHVIGHTVDDGETPPSLAPFSIESIRLSPTQAPGALDALEERFTTSAIDMPDDEAPSEATLGASVRFFGAAARLIRHLLAQHRFVPSLLQDSDGGLRGLWQPWLADGPTVERLLKLASAMPASARAVVDPLGHDAWAILQDFLIRVTDARCRDVLARESMHEAIEGRKAEDSHVAWLRGLLSDDEVPGNSAQSTELVKRVHKWLGGLEDRRAGSDWRLALRLIEPVLLAGPEGGGAQIPDEDSRWILSFHLRSVQRPGVVIDAADIWLLPTGAASVDGQRIESPQEVLLAELGRAARIYRSLENALAEARPIELSLTTAEAYTFLREHKPVLQEQGFDVQVPQWWDMPTIRLGARLQIQSEEVPIDPLTNLPVASRAASARLGLRSLVSYSWQLAIGETTLTLDQFQKLATQRSPLIRLDGRWVEVRPEDVRAAAEFLKQNPGGETEVGQLIRLAYASDPRQTGLPILGMEATGWVASIFGGKPGETPTDQQLPFLTPPETFIGSLRPYQIKGLSWLAFLDQFGLGACLADDMGLGKTIQLLALLAYEREVIFAPRPGEDPATIELPGPTLLVVPMSVVSNWTRETHRFTPNLKVLVHHGMDRLQSQDLATTARVSDLVITTYALAHRDRDQLALIQWRRIVLDEAQNIKNPAAKQTQAVRSIPAHRRVALTGTPVENRLAELWSIVDFLNPGYLGSAGDFRTRFAVPIERYHDPVRSRQLRNLVQPFVLRRLKSDPTVIADLPEKLETKEYCYLTPEQAQLYRSCVSDMLTAADQADGIQRRGVVLAGLVKLKQICNHPAQFFKEFAGTAGEREAAGPPAAARSGKCIRLIEMLDEVVDSGDQALVFTQFRQMGEILAAMLRHALDRDVLFLHGGSTATQRQAMVDAFQKGDGRHPIFILSLKAGGLGLNLTAANHVFHFDRWWNPAVEAQATDRAYRIGQTRSVLVHKYIVSGTLEERIDQMIESKTELAEKVIGSGEQWLTELSTSQLRDLLTLRPEAVADPREVALT